MPLEQLLFFALLVALPLLERLIRAMRERARASPAEPVPATPRQVASRPGVPVPPPHDAGVVPSPRATARAAPARVRVSERPLPRPRVRGAWNLRQAIISMAVLGPCRAIEPWGRAAAGSGATAEPPAGGSARVALRDHR